jgi:hypothetical protein
LFIFQFRGFLPAMSDNTENIVLENLTHIRSRVDQIADDMSDLKQRISGIESSMVLVKREIAHSDETDAPRSSAHPTFGASYEFGMGDG